MFTFRLYIFNKMEQLVIYPFKQRWIRGSSSRQEGQQIFGSYQGMTILYIFPD